jgi:hypothetical protein
MSVKERKMETVKFEWSDTAGRWLCVNPPTTVDAEQVAAARERLGYTPTLVGFDTPGKTEYCLHLDRECNLLAVSMIAEGCAPVKVNIVELPIDHAVVPFLMITTRAIPLIAPTSTAPN